MSLGDVGSLQDMDKDPSFKTVSVDILGRIPVVKHTGLKYFNDSVKASLFLFLARFKPKEQNQKSLDVTASDVKKALPHTPAFFFEPNLYYLSDEFLFLYLTNSGSDLIEQSAEGAGLFEINFDTLMPSQPELKDGYVPIAGKVVFNSEKVLSITLDGVEKHPGDAEWATSTARIRANVFGYNTIVPHSVICHGLLSARLFLLTHSELNHTNPLRALLIPYTYTVEKNLARFLLTVLGKSGVVSSSSPFTLDGANAALKQWRAYGYRSPLTNPFQSSLSVKIGSEIWKAILELVKGYVAATGVDAATLEKAKGFLSEGLWPELLAMPAEEVLSYYMYSVSVLHHIIGHAHKTVGNADSRYVSTSSRRGTAEANSSVEPAHGCMTRSAVIESISRPMPRLADDFSFLCRPDLNSASGTAVVKAFSEKMGAIADRLAALDKDTGDNFYSDYMSPRVMSVSCGV